MEEGGSEVLRGEGVPEVAGLMPLRNTVLFPHGILPISVAGRGSIQLVRDAVKNRTPIGFVTARGNLEANRNHRWSELYSVGSLAWVVKIQANPDGTFAGAVRAFARFAIREAASEIPYLRAQVERLHDVPAADGPELAVRLRERALDYVALSPTLPPQASEIFASIEPAAHLADMIAANLDVDIADKQAVLEELDVAKRIERVLALVESVRGRLPIRAVLTDGAVCGRHRRPASGSCERCGSWVCISCPQTEDEPAWCASCRQRSKAEAVKPPASLATRLLSVFRK